MHFIWKRLIRIRLMSAVILALPGIFLCIWYSSSAILKLHSYEMAVDEKAPGNLEFFHIHLYDILHRDLRWIMSQGDVDKSKIETLILEVGHGSMIDLYGGAGKSEDRPYVPAKLFAKSENKTYKVELRLRGSRHWHYLSRKKTMKIRVIDDKPYRGHQVFNLINQVTPFVVGQKVVTDTAAENGVMVTPYEFVRVVLNGEDLGVFHFQAQPDDTLFRKNRTMYSDFFSGNLDGKAETMALWNDTTHWKKVTSRLHSNKHDIQRLKEFLHHITQSSYRDFARYAHSHINFDAFATFEAIDVVFGIEQHGFRENQKLYFDPYVGSWVPVAWDLRGFKHDGVINRVENPITIRLKMIPEYRARRNRAVWDLLHGDASANTIRKKAQKAVKRIASDLANDRLFSAYKQLPKVNEFAFKMLRPMDMDRLELVLEAEMQQYERRIAFLTNQLQKSEFYVQWGDPITVVPPNHTVSDVATAQAVASEGLAVSGPEPEGEGTGMTVLTPLNVIVAGETGVVLEEISVSFDKDCQMPLWRVVQGDRMIANAENATSATFTSRETLYAAVQLAERTKGDADLNRIMVAPVPTRYALTLESSCRPGNIEVFATHEITQNRIRAQKAGLDLLASMPKSYPPETAAPTFDIGVLTPHPGAVIPPQIETVQLGPGVVEIAKIRVFDEYTHVTVMAGTTFKMGAGASLIFKGKVIIEGRAGNPVVFKPSGKKPWGGVALQGKGTAGSVLSHFELEHGSNITGQPVVYSSMLNIHDTSNITVSGCRIRNNHGLGDAFHGAYVTNLQVADIAVTNVTMDAIDIEFSTANLTRAYVLNAGDDGLDLMDSKVSLSDSVILGCKQHGISAGESSHLAATDFLVAFATNGVFGKDASHIDIGTGLLMKNRTGVRVGKATGLYGGDVEITANTLYIVGADTLVERSDRKRNRLDDGTVRYGFVDDRPLRHFFADVVNIAGPEEIDTWLSAQEVAK
ncbi:MAG: CotH kinase family protein [Deltaproteobacteria bacterium]|nr:CotH kinase family protein [Deltaproteobacteria bacterium]